MEAGLIGMIPKPINLDEWRSANNHSTGFMGVSRHDSVYTANIHGTNLGAFETPEAAAEVFAREYLRIHGGPPNAMQDGQSAFVDHGEDGREGQRDAKMGLAVVPDLSQMSQPQSEQMAQGSQVVMTSPMPVMMPEIPNIILQQAQLAHAQLESQFESHKRKRDEEEGDKGIRSVKRQCKSENCFKAAQGSTGLCHAHGGGKRCQTEGCTKSAQGSNGLCIGHGGGRRCHHEGCTKSSQGGSGLCHAHGGGRRCQHEGCTKSARSRSGLCIGHGGGRRCQVEGCTKSAQGSTGFCKSHGGGRRCKMEGCAKSAQGSSSLCSAHGGGQRCKQDGCNKSAQFSSGLCIAHGGGQTCKEEGCTKSARSSGLCYTHGNRDKAVVLELAEGGDAVQMPLVGQAGGMQEPLQMELHGEKPLTLAEEADKTLTMETVCTAVVHAAQEVQAPQTMQGDQVEHAEQPWSGVL